MPLIKLAIHLHASSCFELYQALSPKLVATLRTDLRFAIAFVSIERVSTIEVVAKQATAAGRQCILHLAEADLLSGLLGATNII